MNYDALRSELRTYYFNRADSRAAKFCSKCLALMDSSYEESMSVFAMKRLQYRTITKEMEPILFTNSPFYYETGTLAAHCDGARDFRGHKSAAGWTYWKNEHKFRDQNPLLWELVKHQKQEKMYLICGPYNDVSQHFCFYHRPILESGLKGVYERAMAQMTDANPGEQDFLISVCEGMLCLKEISKKFADKAEAMLRETTDSQTYKRLSRIAESARRCP